MNPSFKRGFRSCFNKSFNFLKKNKKFSKVLFTPSDITLVRGKRQNVLDRKGVHTNLDSTLLFAHLLLF